MPTIRSSADQADAAVAALETYFPGVQVGSDQGTPLQFSMTASSLPQGVSFLDFTIGGRPLTTRVNDTGGFMFARAVQFDGEMTLGRADVDAAQPYIIHPGLHSRYDVAHAQVLAMDSDAFLSRLGERVTRGSGSFQFTGIGPRTPEYGKYWDAVVVTVAHAIRTGAVDDPLVASSLLDLVVTSSLACFTHTWDDAPSETLPTLPAAVRRARAFIDDNAHTPIAMTDIAQAARMSVRGIQYAFARELQMTPTEYLRRVRLTQARTALLTGNPSAGDTVAAIARSCGFAHPARFAATYRSQYGENPSDTLRRTGNGHPL
ncbi:helix-turn-helix transcriptional regulator [Microbacterium trichothecenolyticum]|uniref:helix-turn-helix transcriptional regulator n=1 Tax=Microbacterium trichothecenolyticum TaxID=69370 RepID=UPI001C6EBA53|nr:AraC family transcriptional regulator [Microbacterium trichothecenolyticum]MBW9119850.1 helix-turn-helix transcriptional regulator [Microbacterium trichothecenolyticum]